MLMSGPARSESGVLLVDLAVVHYALALRVQGWIGDLAVRIEHEFVGGRGGPSSAQPSHDGRTSLIGQNFGGLLPKIEGTSE